MAEITINHAIQSTHQPRPMSVHHSLRQSGSSACVEDLSRIVAEYQQRVETAITQVTVDNQPPEVEILSPTAGQTFDKGLRLVTLRVNASDDLALKNVDFYIDNVLSTYAGEMPVTFTGTPPAG